MTQEQDKVKAVDVIAKNVSRVKHSISNVAETSKKKAVGAAGFAGAAIASGATAVSEKATSAIKETKERWYNPVFFDDYLADDFDRPKLIVIKDEDVRKGNEICEGAIGWLNTKLKPEIFFIYEEFVPSSSLRFSPMPVCDGVYFRHPFEHDLYLQVRDYLEICRNDQLTELKNVAFYLGATHCSVEVHQEKGIIASLTAKGDASANVKKKRSIDDSREFDGAYSSNSSLDIVMNESFEPGGIPQRPKLQWFSHNNEIISLIEKRCTSAAGGAMNSYKIDITSVVSSSINSELAKAVDTSLKAARLHAGFSLATGLKREEKKRFIYKIDF